MAATNGQTLTADAPEPVQEPSMEDILASIRRIIATDQHISGARTLSPAPKPVAPRPIPAPQAAPPPPPVPSPPDSRALPEDPTPTPDYPGEIPNLDDLDPLVSPPAAINPPPASAAPPAPSRREPAVHLHPELFPSPAEIEEVAEVYDLAPSDRVAPSGGDAEDLISSAARDQVSSSFHMLADTVLRDPETIERIARDTLRPMLKTWLDENLPSMVERLVRAEIERVARGGRSRG